MEEIKFATLFPELSLNNKNNKKKKVVQNQKFYHKNHQEKKSRPINLLLYKDDIHKSNKRLETEFLKNKVKFFSPDITIETKKKFQNTTDFKYPNINQRRKIHKTLSKTVNTKINPLYIESKPIIFKMFDKFDEADKRYIQQTKYYNHYNKTGDGRKFNINNIIHTNSIASFLLYPKKTNKKYYSHVYRRIKAIE